MKAPTPRLPSAPARHRAGAGRLLVLGLAVAAAVATGCSTRYGRNVLHDVGRDKTLLRSEKTLGGTELTKGYDHPATISGTRLAHILSRIDIRTDDEDVNSRQPAIPAEMVYDLGDRLSSALAKAGPNEEAIVIASRRDHSLGIFDKDYITSLIAYVKGEQLYIRLYHVDWKQPAGGEQAKIDEPSWTKNVMSFRIVPSEAMTTAGDQTVAVAWRDPIFRSPTAVRVTPTGKIVRRQILMESEAPIEEEAGPEQVPEARIGDLSPDQLRALADLEEQRRDGAVTESDYRAQRARILQGPVSAPGPESAAPEAGAAD